MSDETSNNPEWVRLRDGSQVPFDADRIARSLFTASNSLGEPNAFLARELTDAVVHFLAQDGEAISTAAHIAEQIEKAVRELGHPRLARRYAELQSTAADDTEAEPIVAIRVVDSPTDLVRRSLEAYSLNVVYSRDLRAAIADRLLHVSGLAAPDTLTHYSVDTRTLGNDSWWLHWDEWKSCGDAWIVDSPEWLSILPADRSPIIRLCERIIALPRAAGHPVELHLNVAEPPSWLRTHGFGPLFADADDPSNHSLRFGLQDMLLEQCLSTRDGEAPTIAWHLNEASWRDPSQRGRLKSLVRHTAQGKAVRFLFDRPRVAIMLAEGMDRKNSGVLFEIGLDLAAFARHADISQDGVALLKKLPSLARMAVSAAKQKQQYLRSLPEECPLARGFLIERAACVVTPIGLDAVVCAATGESMTKSPLSLDFAVRIVQTIKDALRQASRSISLDVRLDGQLHSSDSSWSTADTTVSLRKQLETASQLHLHAGGGTMTLLLADENETNVDTLVDLLRWTWQSTSVKRLLLLRASTRLHQGEFPI